ncbi:MAG: gluconate permease [Verrucomicrobiales bacterium]|nr:gluconate permease [Verrucomicrobiales bacterium]
MTFNHSVILGVGFCLFVLSMVKFRLNLIASLIISVVSAGLVGLALTEPFYMPPLALLAIGILIVVGLIVSYKVNAFVALILSAAAVSVLCAPMTAEQLADKGWTEMAIGWRIVRVGEAFGKTAGAIGIVIAMAAIVGKCMMDSGAADRIVRSFLNALGEKRSGIALSGSGFVLSIPVFFDTVFYLLVPLARSLYRSTGKNYVKYVLAISAGAAVTHTVVPPTPGPLLVADTLGVDIGTMILGGLAVGMPAAMAGLVVAGWMDKNMKINADLSFAEGEARTVKEDKDLPGLIVSLLPIVLPVALISVNTVTTRLAATNDGAADLMPLVGTIGNANFALIVSAALAIMIYVRQCKPDREKFAAMMEDGLGSAGIIILITAAGGAFGAMLKVANVGTAIEGLFSGGGAGLNGIMLLPFAFFVSALLKFAQGSTTVAVITTSGMIAAMITPADLPFNPVYIATAIGGGGLIGSWMNDSGFWIFSKMGGISEVDALKTWTPLLCVLGATMFIVTMILATVLPMPIGK